MNYKKLNTIGGWFAFLIAAITYISTMEPVASFWDCGEFIAAAFKLQVPHPPGAPLFLLVGRVFSLFAGGDLEQVAYWVNMVSALSSAFTILFLFWTITLLAKQLLKVEGEPNGVQKILILGAALTGSLAYTFSDSFWFSATEAEVYAFSSFFTAFVFWAILKWNEVAEEEGANRWIILIAYMVGLSIGVHLLNLVAIPALGMVYYFKKYEKPNWGGGILTFIISFVILQIIQIGIIPGLPSVAWWVELKMVNGLGLPFNSGIIIFCALFIGAIVYGIIYSVKHNQELLNLGLLSLVFILIGYSTYAIIAIRANFHPPLNENNPDETAKVISYLKREQYGERPLFFGPQYTASPKKQIDGSPLYKKGEHKYVVYDYKTETEYDFNDKVLIPRMHSRQGGHVDAYDKFIKARSRKWKKGDRPTSAQNISFMFSRQFGFQFFRYFKWNFIGRETDIQDSDSLRPWDSEEMPYNLKSKARNNLFALPLILGLLGLVFQFKKNEKQAIVMIVLFVMTGLAINFFLNQPPYEPRERDYTYVGAFYAFAIWIGLGVIAIYEWVGQHLLKREPAALLSVVISLGIPALMAAKEWDDHDRSNRYHSVDSAKNLLNSCAKNAILFTGGDNDTFPLWYVQEVEGFRTDVRVCNLSLLNTDWYIDQMKEDTYESEGLPISLDRERYIQGTNDVVYYSNISQKQKDAPMMLDLYMNLLKKDHKKIRHVIPNNKRFKKYFNVFPSKLFVLDVDSSALSSGNVIPEKYKDRLKTTLAWSIGKNYLEKKDLIMLDMIININKNNWERPIYFSTTLGFSNFLGLKDHMSLEGLAYRLYPTKFASPEGELDVEVMYDNLMNNFFWRNMDNPEIYYDENYKRFSLNARSQYYRLALELFRSGDKAKALEVIDKCFEVMPDEAIPYDIYSAQFIPLYFQMGEKETGQALSDLMEARAREVLQYILNNPNGAYGGHKDISKNILRTIARVIFNEDPKSPKLQEIDSILKASGGPGLFENRRF